MTEWIGALPALVVALLVLFLPGLLIAWVLRVRGFALIAAAPVLTTGVAALLAIAYGVAGIAWRPLAALTGFVALALLLWALRRGLRLGPIGTHATGPRWALLAGLAAGGGILLVQLTTYIGSPDAISQTNDAVLHLNAVRYAVDTGDASSFLISGVQGAAGFYPAAWHALVALVAQLGVDLTVATNVVALALSYAAWPLGIAWLVLATLGSRITAGLAATTSAAFATFPLLLLQWGVLYPLHASIALLPGAIAIGAGALRWTVPDGAATPGRIVAGAARVLGLCGIAAAAIALSQPATLLPLALGVWLIAAGRVAAGWRTAPHRIARLALTVAGGAAVAAAWLVLGGFPSDGHWAPSVGKATAVAQVFTQSHLGAPPLWLVSALVIAGLVRALIVTEARWLAVLWVLLSGLYITAVAIHHDVLRRVLIGAWYEDPYRLAALTAVASVPLAALGAEGLVRALARVLPARRIRPVVAIGAPALALTVAVVTVSAVPPVFRDTTAAGVVNGANTYDGEASDYLDDDERALLERLDEIVPADATVLGNPGTGTGFGYALSGRDVVPRTWHVPEAMLETLGDHLADAAEDPAVCDTLDRYGVDYVLDFGVGPEYPGRWPMPGFSGLAPEKGFELVASEGEATLWRVTACD